MSRLFRWCIAIAVAVLPLAVLADPPGRVGRLAVADGSVSFRASYAEAPERATINWPITSGNVIQTGPDGLAEIRIGSSAIALDRASELELGQLNDERIGLRLLAGRISIRVNDREEAADFSIGMMHGHARLDETGRYRFDVTPRATTVSVFQGTARFEIAAGQILIAAGRRVQIWGDDASSYRADIAVRDAFDDWAFARDRDAPLTASAPYVSPEMTGYEDLDRHGQWQTVEEYGPVWFPRVVPAGWAPYRDGRWGWVAPWGWTWVDAAPWGFAPFHYGRWVQLGPRWAWWPGPYVRRPVFSPGFVAWQGHPGGWRPHGPAVGWTVLGPREPFRPHYAHSPHYGQFINQPHLRHNYRPPQPPMVVRVPPITPPRPEFPPVQHPHPIVRHDRPQLPPPVAVAPPPQHHHRPNPPQYPIARHDRPPPVAVTPPPQAHHHQHHHHPPPRIAPPVPVTLPPAPHAPPQQRRYERK